MFGLICIAIGIYTLCGAYFNWNWFINYPFLLNRAVLSLLGRRGARIFYGFIGCCVTVFGITAMLGGSHR